MLSIPLMAGCKQDSAASQAPASRALQPRQESPKARTADTTAARRTVLFLGDSLTAGFRLAPTEAYPALIESHWRKQGLSWRARNAGVSGDTSAGVLRRLDWVLTPDVHTVFLAIGGNDGLRGQSLAKLEQNLAQIIQTIQKKNVRVILAGIKIPRNYGKPYYRKFEQIYERLAKRYKIPLMPFLLQDVAGVKKLNLPDGIHPNAQGHQIVARNVLAYFHQARLFPKPAK